LAREGDGTGSRLSARSFGDRNCGCVRIYLFMKTAHCSFFPTIPALRSRARSGMPENFLDRLVVEEFEALLVIGFARVIHSYSK